jgi:hypothetical protein
MWPLCNGLRERLDHRTAVEGRTAFLDGPCEAGQCQQLSMAYLLCALHRVTGTKDKAEWMDFHGGSGRSPSDSCDEQPTLVGEDP